jgi:hypothetical protein
MVHDSFLELRSTERQEANDLSLFSLWSCLGSVSFLTGRGLARIIPWDVIVPALTRFSESRVNQERVRILTEVGDYAGFAIWLFLACIAFWYTQRVSFYVESNSSLTRNVKQVVRSPLLALGILFVNLAAVHPWRIDSFGDQLFIGFGLGTAAAGVLVSFTVGLLPTGSLYGLHARITESRSVRTFAWFGLVILIIAQILIPNENAGRIRHDLIYLNELAAPSVGLQPLLDYSPTYSNVLGYPLWVFTEVFGTSNLMLTFSLYWALLGAACWLFSILIFSEVLRWRLVWAGWLAVVLLSITASRTIPQSGFPVWAGQIRIVLSVLTFLFFLKALKKQNPAQWKLVSLGVLSGLTVVNNADFGFTAVVAVLSGIFIWTLWGGLPKRVISVLFVSTAATTTILFFLLGGGNVPSAVSSYLLFVQSRPVGGPVQAVPTFGLHIFATACHGLAALFGWRVLQSKETDHAMRLVGVFGLISAIWGILTFPSYLGGPNPTFAGTLWLPLAFSLVTLFSNSRIRLSARNLVQAGSTTAHAPIRVSGVNQIIVAFLFCALTSSTNPQITLDWWMDERWRLDRTVGLNEDAVLQELQSRLQADKTTEVFGYYGEYANLFELLLDVPAVYGVHDPMIAYSSRSTVEATCRTLRARRPSRVLASTRYLPEQFKSSSELEGPCPGMRRVDSRDGKVVIEYVYTPSE